MSGDLKSRLPRCGLYRTTQALPAHEAQVPAGVLVYFHNHSESGLPQVVLPDHSRRNQWHFHGPGVCFRALSWAATLVKLPAQGLYMLRGELVFAGGRWPRRTLVQVGFSRAGQAVAFLAHERGDGRESGVWFPERGVPIAPEQFAQLAGPLHVRKEGVADDGHPRDLTHAPSEEDSDDDEG